MELMSADIPFYQELASDPAVRGRPVLEVACGTGRVLIPLARDAAAGRGASVVVGLDRSHEMLRVCARKLAEEPDPVRDRARLFRADMAGFALRGRFALAIIAFRSLVNLPDQATQIRALERVREALEPGGRAVVDLFFPDLGYLAVGIAEPRAVSSYVERATGCRLEFAHRARFDPVSQTIDDTLEERRTFPDGRVATCERTYRLRFPFCDEFKLMARVAGLEVEAVHGWFDGRPLGADAREMVFLLRRPG